VSCRGGAIDFGPSTSYNSGTSVMCFSHITAGLADFKNENEDLFFKQSVISMYLFFFFNGLSTSF